MAQKSHGSLHGSRHKLSKDRRESTTVNDYFKEFEEGEKVLIKYNPSVQEGRVHQRFHGKAVEVVGTKGNSYEVRFKDGKKEKTLYVNPIHLQKLE